MTFQKIGHTWLFLLGMIILASVSGVGAQAAPAIVRPEPPALEVVAGAVQTISMRLENATDVYGIDVRASFDPSLIEIVDADPSKTGVQVVPGSFPQPDFVALNEADNGAGTLRYVITQVNPTPPATGSGTLFTFQVRGKAGGDSQLRIDLVEMSNRSGELLPVQTAGSSVRVIGVATPQPTGIVLATPSAEDQPSATTNASTTATTTSPSAQSPAATTEATALAQALSSTPSSATPSIATSIQPTQPGGEATQPAVESQGGATENDPMQDSAAVVSGNGTPPAAQNPVEDPMAVTQPDSATGGAANEQEGSAPTTSNLAVVGAAGSADETAPVSEETATDYSPSMQLVALVVALIILAAVVVVLVLRAKAG